MNTASAILFYPKKNNYPLSQSTATSPHFTFPLFSLPPKIWVLAPLLDTRDAHIDYYYDFTQSIEEYTRVFEELKLDWLWQPVTLKDMEQVVVTIAEQKNQCTPLVLNLCDGDEINGTPGISVIQLLEKHQLIYTGSDEFFYRITTSKIPMKEAFDRQNVPTPRWCAIKSPHDEPSTILSKTGVPVLVKPAVSGGSMGVGVRNVVDDEPSLKSLLAELFAGYRGWNLQSDGFIAEQFIEGPEFTVFLTGSHDRPGEAKIYQPVERVFHPSLPEKEKFLSFDRLWEIYETETMMPEEENFYEYRVPEENLIEPLKQLAWNAYVSNKGVGYTRADIRMDAKTGKMYVLEVNAQCGISDDENFTSIGAILRLSGNRFVSLINDLLQDAILRAKNKGWKIS